MAHPLAVAENAMRSFVLQWLSGLAPSLRLLTNPNGSVIVLSEVSSSLNVSEVHTTAGATCCRRRSGHKSRLRRRKERSRRNDLEFTETINSNISVPELQPSLVPTSVEPDSTYDFRAVPISSVKSNLSVKKLSSIDISPEKSLYHPNLVIDTLPFVSISPRVVHHPAIVNACYAIIGKHPNEMTESEEEQFELYKQFKARKGELIEEDPVYVPIGGTRICLHCENPT